MLAVIIRRLVSLPLVLVSVTFLTFIVGYLAPGDPILTMMGNQRDPVVYQNLRHLYGLDSPWYEQYWRYLQGLLHGDLGMSYRYAQRPVSHLIFSGVKVSLALGGVALAASLLLGIPLGMYAAFHHNGWGERLSMVPMLALFAIPSFVLIPILQWINYQVYLRGWPSLPAAGWGSLQYWVMPVIVLAAGNLGYMARMTRANVLEVLRQDYVRTARGKGLPEQIVRTTHVLRNALLPIVTVIGPAVAFLVTGAFVVESLFSIPGVGFLSVQAVQQRDYPVIQGTVVVLTVAVVLMNLLTDIAYTLLDPRVRLDA
ncbi:MAG TPA: ABC transporter permease [Thermomicrobiales bacterium]|jgi:peptide/nickel transport system permease protein/oligopeptide transport system permease protein